VTRAEERCAIRMEENLCCMKPFAHDKFAFKFNSVEMTLK